MKNEIFSWEWALVLIKNQNWELQDLSVNILNTMSPLPVERLKTIAPYAITNSFTKLYDFFLKELNLQIQNHSAKDKSLEILVIMFETDVPKIMYEVIELLKNLGPLKADELTEFVGKTKHLKTLFNLVKFLINYQEFYPYILESLKHCIIICKEDYQYELDNMGREVFDYFSRPPNTLPCYFFREYIKQYLCENSDWITCRPPEFTICRFFKSVEDRINLLEKHLITAHNHWNNIIELLIYEYNNHKNIKKKLKKKINNTILLELEEAMNIDKQEDRERVLSDIDSIDREWHRVDRPIKELLLKFATEDPRKEIQEISIGILKRYNIEVEKSAINLENLTLEELVELCLHSHPMIKEKAINRIIDLWDGRDELVYSCLFMHALRGNHEKAFYRLVVAWDGTDDNKLDNLLKIYHTNRNTLYTGLLVSSVERYKNWERAMGKLIDFWKVNNNPKLLEPFVNNAFKIFNGKYAGLLLSIWNGRNPKIKKVLIKTVLDKYSHLHEERKDLRVEALKSLIEYWNSSDKDIEQAIFSYFNSYSSNSKVKLINVFDLNKQHILDFLWKNLRDPKRLSLQFATLGLFLKNNIITVDEIFDLIEEGAIKFFPFNETFTPEWDIMFKYLKTEGVSFTDISKRLLKQYSDFNFHYFILEYNNEEEMIEFWKALYFKDFTLRGLTTDDISNKIKLARIIWDGTDKQILHCLLSWLAKTYYYSKEILEVLEHKADGEKNPLLAIIFNNFKGGKFLDT